CTITRSEDPEQGVTLDTFIFANFYIYVFWFAQKAVLILSSSANKTLYLVLSLEKISSKAVVDIEYELDNTDTGSKIREGLYKTFIVTWSTSCFQNILRPSWSYFQLLKITEVTNLDFLQALEKLKVDLFKRSRGIILIAREVLRAKESRPSEKVLDLQFGNVR
ncbi:hypothetical protein Tco_0980099, partial [Tanacetum coccineum]